jgi:hypothetical protein
MLGGLGALAAGTAYYFFGTAGTPEETARELKSKAQGLGAAAEGKLGLRHSQADYQKVYNRIAEMMEKEDHDGEWASLSIAREDELTGYRWFPCTCFSPTRLARFRYLRQGQQHGWVQLRYHAIPKGE